jgi:hypothetical protein
MYAMQGASARGSFALHNADCIKHNALHRNALHWHALYFNAKQEIAMQTAELQWFSL